MGRGKDLSSAVKGAICALKKEGKSLRSIAQQVGCSKTAVANTLALWKSTKSVKGKRKNCGRKKKLTAREFRKIVTTVKRDRRSTSKELALEVQKSSGKIVGSSTVRRLLYRYGLKGRIARRKPFISAVNRQKRLKFAKDHSHWTVADWKRVIWTDEKKFNSKGSDGKRYVRRTKDEEFSLPCLQGTTKSQEAGIMMWAAFSAAGVGPIVKLKGKVNATCYIGMLQKNFLSFAESELPLNHIFMQDNAPIHTASTTRTWFHDNKIAVLQWPPQSPDLNPIENLWAVVAKRAAELRKQMKLERAVVTAWKEISQKECMQLVASMPKRCQEVIKRLGYPTHY